ncbi:MAG: hypothetical protein ACREE7_01630, partial [Dongiaceae bacterium]
MQSFPSVAARAAACGIVSLCSASSYADHTAYGNCPTSHYGAAQGLSYYVTGDATGALIGDGAELDVSQGNIGLLFHFRAEAFGTCEIRLYPPACNTVGDTYERTVSHIRVEKDVRSTVLNGTYAVGRVEGRDPATGA